MSDIKKTPFSDIYDKFFTIVTDDMYNPVMGWTFIDTFRDLQNILMNAIPMFEFPRFNINDYELGSYEDLGTYCGVDSNYITVPAAGWVGGTFNSELTNEEINIIATYMVAEWFKRQIATIENTREKFTGSDFKMTSQANHMAKLKVMLDTWTQNGFHLQRLYKRRESKDGIYRSTVGLFMTTPDYGYRID